MVRVIFGACTTALFLVSVAVHLSTFVKGIEPLPDVASMFGHFAVVLAGMVSVAFFIEQLGTRYGPVTGALFNKLVQAQKLIKRSVIDVVLAIPIAIRSMAVCIVIYTVVSFFRLDLLMDGTPELGEEGPYLKRHGEFVKPLTLDEYRRYASYQIRSISGHWIVISMMSALYFWFAYDTLKEKSTITPES